MTKIPVAITRELIALYESHNEWGRRGKLACCNAMGPGPHEGFCTLRRGHGGLHVAHNNPHYSDIYQAWYDCEPHLLMDEGL